MMNFSKNQGLDDDVPFQKIGGSPNPGADSLQAGKKEGGISNQTRDKVEAAKSYIEGKYARMKKEEIDKKEKWSLLNEKMDNLNLDTTEKEKIKREILHKEAEQMRMKRKKLTPEDFDPVNIIGRGAFGEVRLCKWKEFEEIVVIKKMKKSEMVFKNQVTHIRAERDVLAAANIPWIVELKCSFQDDIYLYLVMEYLPGGDLMTLLMKKDILSEDESKFYIAETILAIDAVHKLNYIHRDLKPDNILIDRGGHIKLTDFGLCKHTEIRPKKIELGKKPSMESEKPGLQLEIGKKPGYRRNRQLAYSTVGTPDYIAPEVFQQNGYTETVDWWSLGTILYEMLVGYPPFFSEDPSLTCQKILHWRKTFTIPAEANLSPAAVDLLRRLITDSNERLGINGVEEIKAHPFFAGIDWKKLREKKAPIIPELKNETDTSNFDKFDEEEPWIPDYSKMKKSRKDVNFIGYTFNRNIENQRSSLVAALIDLETSKQSTLTKPLSTNATTSNEENEKDNEQVFKPDAKNFDKNIELAQESLNRIQNNYENLKSSLVTNKIPTNNSPFNESLNSGQKPGSFKVKAEHNKAVSPINQMAAGNPAGLGNLKTNNNSSSGSSKNLLGSGSSQLNTQSFASKLDSNLSSLKKNNDPSVGGMGPTSHLKSNNTQNLAKGLSKLNDNKPQNDAALDKANFTGGLGKYTPGAKFPTKDYK